MSMEILKGIIENFSATKFIDFFIRKNSKFRPLMFPISEFNNEHFTDGVQLGEVKLKPDHLIVCAFRVLGELKERSSKKRQYEIGKKVLKYLNSDAGIFIFYDGSGNFRFSLIYAEYQGTTRKFSLYKRFTFYVSPQLTNKTFLQQIGGGNFSSLDSIKEAFSVEPVTKQFYQEIANWYFWAVKVARFPKDAEAIPNGRNIAVIRLITRLIFIWFMKEKRLVPDGLFDERVISNILKDFTPNSDNYYKAILQNLFFATLNTKREDRRFRSDKRGYRGYNTDFGNHNVFRYEDLFKNSEEVIEKYFMPIPFLNGGLFECLDYKSKNKDERKYIDGFTDVKSYQPSVPNYLFFSDGQIVDLSEDYNDKKYKKTPVKGLIKILQQYNFTVDENEPDDIEIALDPELLGKIFENLLASYNPETATTARKATGSYYTPREIVDFMVDESLKEYFRTHITGIDEEKLERLFSKGDSKNPFDSETTSKLIGLIDSLRVVDPAVGSGAFPMRILSKLVFLLHKLDPDNTYWKKVQIEGIVKSVKDPVLQKELIERIERRFKEKNPDYGRKLYLIEKCIYGVDIQQIAVEIAKLRFFISLLVDEEVDFSKSDENYGIEPLPNLDFKIMQGNSLVSTFYGLDFKSRAGSGELPGFYGFDEKLRELVKEFEDLKEQYQNESDVEKKRNLRLRIDEKILAIFEEKLKEHLPELRKIEEKAMDLPKQEQRDEYIRLEKRKLFDRIGLNLEKAKEELIAYTEGRKDKNFFLWDIYFAEVFAEKGGFDIVIGNPPYVRHERIRDQKPLLKSQGYEVFDSTADLYVYFYEKGYDLLRENGILTYISSNKWMRAEYGTNLRKFLKKNTAVLKLIDFGGYRVFEQTVDTNIVVLKKQKPAQDHMLFFVEVKSDVDKVVDFIKSNLKKMPQAKLSDETWTLGDEKTLALKEKIEKVGKPLREWDVKIYRGVLTGFNEAFIIDTETRNKILANCKTEQERKRTEEIIKPVLRGKDIGRYYYKWAGLWVICTFPSKKIDIENYPSLKEYLASFGEKLLQDGKPGHRKKTPHKWYETQDNIAYYPEFEKEKVVWQEIVREPSFAYDENGMYIEATGFIMTGQDLKYLLGLLNSRPVSYLFKKFYSGGGLGEEGYRYKKEFLQRLPIPPINNQNKSLVDQIVKNVNQILSLTQSPDYETSKEKQAKVKEFEKEIDRLVYELYGLTEEEIKLIEGGEYCTM